MAKPHHGPRPVEYEVWWELRPGADPWLRAPATHLTEQEARLVAGDKGRVVKVRRDVLPGD